MTVKTVYFDKRALEEIEEVRKKSIFNLSFSEVVNTLVHLGYKAYKEMEGGKNE